MIATLHRKLFSSGILKQTRLSKPVISVGNLTMGGTGKTPFVDYLLGQADEKHIRCGILTRGYGRKSRDNLLVNEASSTRNVGDEPLWLFKRHPNAKIAVGADRVSSSKLLNNDVDCFILDDGLQHHKIARDFEIILIDATVEDRMYLPPPIGRGREGFSALKFANLVVLTKCGFATEARVAQLRTRAQNYIGPGVIVVESSLELSSVELIQNLQKVDLKGKKLLLVSGIGNPQSFEKLFLKEQIALHLKFSDHHNYSLGNLVQIGTEMQKHKADLIVMTDKDAVKIRELFQGASGELGTLPLASVSVKLKFKQQLPDIYGLAHIKHH